MDQDTKWALFAHLSGRHLHAVTFVLDYIQLLFEPPATINAYSPISVRSDEGMIVRVGDDQFRNYLCAQITKEVGAALIVDAKSFNLAFVGGSGITISLAPEDYVGPEAIEIIGDGYRLVI